MNVYYLHNRDWGYLYHFIFWQLGALNYVSDDTIYLCIPYIKELEDGDKKPKVTKEKQEVIDKMKKSLDAKVSDVIASSRLVDSAACLVLSKDEPGAQLKRILEASGQSFGDSKPVFEVNLKHKLIKKLGSMSGKEFSNFSQFLFDYAVIAEGGTPKDPAKYLRQLDKYLS